MAGLGGPAEKRSLFNVTKANFENPAAVIFAVRLNGKLIGEAALCRFNYRGDAGMECRGSTTGTAMAPRQLPSWWTGASTRSVLCGWCPCSHNRAALSPISSVVKSMACKVKKDGYCSESLRILSKVQRIRARNPCGCEHSPTWWQMFSQIFSTVAATGLAFDRE